METNKITISLYLPSKSDLTKSESIDISVTTIFNPENNTFLFKCRIPKHIFDNVKDTDTKYLTTPPKHEYNESKPIKFTQYLSSNILSDLTNQLIEISRDVKNVVERNTAKTEKYIAVSFIQNNEKRRDSFSFASMGYQIKSSFQYFVVYKAIKSPNTLDRYTFKSHEIVSGVSNNIKKDGWYWYTPGVVEKFQLIKWTQEREDSLENLKNKFIDINGKLESFLGDINDEKK